MGVKVGDIVYYIDRIPDIGHYSIEFGVVAEVYTSEIYVNIYEPKRTRYVNGVDSEDLPYVGDWMKLPKNWRQKVFDLLDIRYEYPEEITTQKFDKEGLLKLIDEGILVLPSKNDHMRIETDISNNGYRILKKPAYHYDYKPDGITLTDGEYYLTYEEASDKRNKIIAEMDRISNLTDKEWSIEQIDKTLTWFQRATGTPVDEVMKIYEKLLALNHIEDIETRYCNGRVQYKYTDQIRWKDV